MSVMFFDVETTGLPKSRRATWSQVNNWPRIVSIAWVIEAEKQVLDRQHFIVKPDGFEIPVDAERIHGISTEKARRDGARWRDVANSLLRAVDRHNVQKLVAHNMDFDRPVLLSELCRTGLSTSLSNVPTFCTMKTYADLKGGKWPRLDELYLKLIGRELVDAHDALIDVEACRACYPIVEAMVTGNVCLVEDDSQQHARELVDLILDWSWGNPNFDTSFVEKMQDRLDIVGSLSPRQIAALENIKTSWCN